MRRALVLGCLMLGCKSESPAPPVTVAPPAVAAAWVPPSAPPATPVDAGAADAGAELLLLERDVAALLARACNPCHSWSPRSVVHARSACREGGPLVVPGSPQRSPLYRKVSGSPACGGRMPPTGRLPLGAAEVLEAWIVRGAPVGGRVSVLQPEVPEPEEDWGVDPN